MLAIIIQLFIFEQFLYLKKISTFLPVNHISITINVRSKFNPNTKYIIQIFIISQDRFFRNEPTGLTRRSFYLISSSPFLLYLPATYTGLVSITFLFDLSKKLSGRIPLLLYVYYFPLPASPPNFLLSLA